VNGKESTAGQSLTVPNAVRVRGIPVSLGALATVPDATQHNVPAWTLFAMFFVVSSMGTTLVRERKSGSFTRLATMPTSYLVAMLSKQIVYLGTCMLQLGFMFGLGMFLLPHLGLSALVLPADTAALLFVSGVAALCAVSFALCLGAWTETVEQVNGTGAVAIIILAAIGGILVPSFAMPGSFTHIMKLSPFYWSLQSYYRLFLQSGTIADIVWLQFPLLGMILVLQLLAFARFRLTRII
jgi:ABC-2 type transport system permease protein